ncbi:MAG: hypothetical protein PHT32_06955, partial [Candidatus Omnitrophica bacterium]|nr:hypothetical protein [Candidatus Omnitrophota bacterium]
MFTETLKNEWVGTIRAHMRAVRQALAAVAKKGPVPVSLAPQKEASPWKQYRVFVGAILLQWFAVMAYLLMRTFELFRIVQPRARYMLHPVLEGLESRRLFSSGPAVPQLPVLERQQLEPPIEMINTVIQYPGAALLSSGARGNQAAVLSETITPTQSNPNFGWIVRVDPSNPAETYYDLYDLRTEELAATLYKTHYDAGTGISLEAAGSPDVSGDGMDAMIVIWQSADSSGLTPACQFIQNVDLASGAEYAVALPSPGPHDNPVLNKAASFRFTEIGGIARIRYPSGLSDYYTVENPELTRTGVKQALKDKGIPDNTAAGLANGLVQGTGEVRFLVDWVNNEWLNVADRVYEFTAEPGYSGWQESVKIKNAMVAAGVPERTAADNSTALAMVRSYLEDWLNAGWFDKTAYDNGTYLFTQTGVDGLTKANQIKYSILILDRGIPEYIASGTSTLWAQDSTALDAAEKAGWITDNGNNTFTFTETGVSGMAVSWKISAALTDAGMESGRADGISSYLAMNDEDRINWIAGGLLSETDGVYRLEQPGVTVLAIDELLSEQIPALSGKNAVVSGRRMAIARDAVINQELWKDIITISADGEIVIDPIKMKAVVDVTNALISIPGLEGADQVSEGRRSAIARSAVMIPSDWAGIINFNDDGSYRDINPVKMKAVVDVTNALISIPGLEGADQVSEGRRSAIARSAVMIPSDWEGIINFSEDGSYRDINPVKM